MAMLTRLVILAHFISTVAIRQLDDVPEESQYPPQNNFGQYHAPAWMSNQLQLEGGGFDQPLVPALVPKAGEHLVCMNRESAKWIETNEYMWYSYEFPILRLRGKWQSNYFGHKSVHVEDLTGREIFKIRQSKHVMDPRQLRYSFRILPAGSKSNDEALFTINKDNIGAGFLFLKEEWWVWRGKERMHQLAYYCQGSYLGWDYKFYRSKEEYTQGAQPVAWIQKEANAGAVFGRAMEWLPENYRIHITAGQDTALIMSVSTIIDMVHDHRQRSSFIEQNQTVEQRSINYMRRRRSKRSFIEQNQTVEQQSILYMRRRRSKK